MDTAFVIALAASTHALGVSIVSLVLAVQGKLRILPQVRCEQLGGTDARKPA
jgi:hypothetical protein